MHTLTRKGWFLTSINTLFFNTEIVGRKDKSSPHNRLAAVENFLSEIAWTRRKSFATFVKRGGAHFAHKDFTLFEWLIEMTF